MPHTPDEAREILLGGLNEEQRAAVGSGARLLLVVAGAGSGKTEVMARRVAWWTAVEGIPKEQIIAFTFTEAAAKELKFRIRRCLERVTPQDENPILGGMYIGTIHGFCLKALRDFAPDEFYMFDVLDEAGRAALVEQGRSQPLGLLEFQAEAQEAGRAKGRFGCQELFLRGYDLLNEYGKLDVSLPDSAPPNDAAGDWDWCRQAELKTDVGSSKLARAFSTSAARYYAYLRSRRFLDFSTIQSEALRRLEINESFQRHFNRHWKRLVVDEVQDINPVQYKLIARIVGKEGHLTAVGDHRQAIYSFRGGRVDLMGRLFKALEAADEGHVQELSMNHRSTPRIIELANEWSKTIGDTAGMTNPAMEHGRAARRDSSGRHVAQLHFRERTAEAGWIAGTIASMVRTGADGGVGAFHDNRDGEARGLALSDIALLVRSGTDIRTYQEALRGKGIPAVVRGGPDLFSQPEVLLFLGAIAICSGVSEFYGNKDAPRSMSGRIWKVLCVEPEPEEVVRAAMNQLRGRGLAVPGGAAGRLMTLCRAIRHRLESTGPQPEDMDQLGCDAECRQWLRSDQELRRIFPQRIFQWLLREAGFPQWRAGESRAAAESAMFHVGQLSSLMMSIERSGWVSPKELKWRFIALLDWGADDARIPEAQLLAGPDAVSITTIHSAKGLEFAAVFLADVCARRFPNGLAKRPQKVPSDDTAPGHIDPAHLSDNENYDDERRLMYVALTRAERYLFVTASGEQRSRFFKGLSELVEGVGGTVSEGPLDISEVTEHHPQAIERDDRLSTTFSDLRYFLECPHDFYMRNVLGFAPVIGQEFGFGRGLHNLLRVIHSDPRHWAGLASDPHRLRAEIRALIDRGRFYLRYTSGPPLRNLQASAVKRVSEYVKTYEEELAQMEFKPEKEFETLMAEEDLLVSGAIDAIRLDDPPRVSIIDFKSGNAEAENGDDLPPELMALQVGIYGLAARDELSYEPQHGLIRYIGASDTESREVRVDLGDAGLERVREEIIRTAGEIRRRDFHRGPTGYVEDRCSRCDFLNICPRQEAEGTRRGKR